MSQNRPRRCYCGKYFNVKNFFPKNESSKLSFQKYYAFFIIASRTLEQQLSWTPFWQFGLKPVVFCYS